MSAVAPPTPPRDTLLLSHVNPEDNEFTLWLALQLANEGYRVWCDLTKLLGGEDNIEDVIKTREKGVYPAQDSLYERIHEKGSGGHKISSHAPIRRRCLSPKDVKIAVVGTNPFR